MAFTAAEYWGSSGLAWLLEEPSPPPPPAAAAEPGNPAVRSASVAKPTRAERRSDAIMGNALPRLEPEAGVWFLDHAMEQDLAAEVLDTLPSDAK